MGYDAGGPGTRAAGQKLARPDYQESTMPEACSRCGKPGEAPPAHRVPFPAPVKQKVLESICATCWQGWEEMEVKVINEYRLNFLDPEHRQVLQRACLEYLQLPA